MGKLRSEPTGARVLAAAQWHGASIQRRRLRCCCVHHRPPLLPSQRREVRAPRVPTSALFTPSLA